MDAALSMSGIALPLRKAIFILIAASCWLRAADATEWVPQPDTRIISFAGHNWYVKDSSGIAVGPGPNIFDGANVEIRQDQLHLQVSRRNGRWTSAEVVSTASFGYGRYTFRIGSEISSLGPNIVLGLFTWSDDPAFSHREVDIEISRWGDSSNANAQCVVQPYERPGAIIRFEVPKGLTNPVYSFTWTPEAMTCEIAGGSGSSSFRFEHRFTEGIPVAGGENARINLWLFGGHPPAREPMAEIVIAGFSFTPLSNLVRALK